MTMLSENGILKQYEIAKILPVENGSAMFQYHEEQNDSTVWPCKIFCH